MEETTVIILISNSAASHPVEQVLSSSGYRVVRLDSKDTAKSDIKEYTPAMVILDVPSLHDTCPGIISSINSDDALAPVPVLALISSNEWGRRRALLEMGVDDFLSSPVDEVELQTRVRMLLKVHAYNQRILDYEKDVEAEVNRRTRELTLAFEKVKIASLDTVYRLSRAAEYRDDDVGAHIERMSHYSTAIARAMNLEEDFIENILWAAPMHDVGKIGIPDSILRKPGKLDADEWEIMKEHTTIGSEILKDSTTDFIRLADDIALSHHEKWDGSGYPRGLKGTEIPLAGRIVALADVFDALTSARPYKEAFPLEKAMAIIREDTGSHFDPDIVEAFFSVEKEIIKELNFWKFMSSESDSEGLETDLSDLFGD